MVLSSSVEIDEFVYSIELACRLTHETAVLFSVQHMRRLVKQGRWEGALMYLNTFLPPLTDNHRRSNHAQIFHTFLLMHYRFARVLAGNKEKSLDKQFAGNRWSSSDAELRFFELKMVVSTARIDRRDDPGYKENRIQKPYKLYNAYL